MADPNAPTARPVVHGLDRPIEVNLNLNVRGLRPSATVAINELSDALIRDGKQVYKLGLGQSPFPVPESVGESLRHHAFEKDYLPVKGLHALRQEVARSYRDEVGIEVTAEDVIIGPGSKELMFLLQLVFYGDIVIPTPAWVSYAPQASIIGRHVRYVSCRAEDDWKLRPEALDRLCHEDPGRPRVLILNYPSNPTGATYSATELADIAEVAKKNQVIVLSDEIYGRLHHQGAHQSLVSSYPEGSIYSSGLSKWCGAGGWRLGLFVVPPGLRWLLDAMAAVASETFTSTSAPIQYAAIRAFEGGPDIDDYLDRSRRVLDGLGRRLAARLRRTGARVVEPQGGFYLFPDFSPLSERLAARGITTSAALCERALTEANVAFLPGSHFGRPPGELTARIAYVNFDGAAAIDALDADTVVDDDFLERRCGETVAATEAICDWLDG